MCLLAVDQPSVSVMLTVVLTCSKSEIAFNWESLPMPSVLHLFGHPECCQWCGRKGDVALQEASLQSARLSRLDLLNCAELRSLSFPELDQAMAQQLAGPVNLAGRKARPKVPAPCPVPIFDVAHFQAREQHTCHVCKSNSFAGNQLLSLKLVT